MRTIVALLFILLQSVLFAQLSGDWQGVLIQDNPDGTTSNFSVWVKIVEEGTSFSGKFRSEQVPPPYFKISTLEGERKENDVLFEEMKIVKDETQKNFRWCLIKAKLTYDESEGKLKGIYISKNEWCMSGKLVLVKSNKKFNESNTEVVRESTISNMEKLLLKNESVVGVQFILENVGFLSSKFSLKENSFSYLNKVVDILLKNKSIKIHLKGHTDSDGEDENNFILSQKRAKSVAGYFIKKGIVKERITYEGFGKSRPIVENDSDKNKQINRRVELLIISE